VRTGLIWLRTRKAASVV